MPVINLQTAAQIGSFAELAYNKDGMLANGQPPLGWKQIGADTTGSFAAFAYQNQTTGQIVIKPKGSASHIFSEEKSCHVARALN